MIIIKITTTTTTTTTTIIIIVIIMIIIIIIIIMKSVFSLYNYTITYTKTYSENSRYEKGQFSPFLVGIVMIIIMTIKILITTIINTIRLLTRYNNKRLKNQYDLKVLSKLIKIDKTIKIIISNGQFSPAVSLSISRSLSLTSAFLLLFVLEPLTQSKALCRI